MTIIKNDLKGHSFTDEIMEAQLPPNWKGLLINRYDGITDPDEHINVYKTQMSLYSSEKIVWCRVFPTSLKNEHSVGSLDFHLTRWIISKPCYLNSTLNLQQVDHVI